MDPKFLRNQVCCLATSPGGAGPCNRLSQNTALTLSLPPPPPPQKFSKKHNKVAGKA